MSAGGDSQTAGGNKTTKPQHNIERKHTMNALKKLILGISLLLTLLGGAANAAQFKLETVVPGYPGYTLVRPELRSVLGGRVRWNSVLRDRPRQSRRNAADLHSPQHTGRALLHGGLCRGFLCKWIRRVSGGESPLRGDPVPRLAKPRV
jgi:hypothetical protein